MARAYILASGPSLDRYNFDLVPVNAFVIAVNYAGYRRRVDAIAAVDVHRWGIFDGVYSLETPIHCVEPGLTTEKFRTVISHPECPVKIRTSSAGLGLYALAKLGFRDVLAIGFDMQFTNTYSHAKSLVDAGFYTSAEEEVCPPLRNAIEIARVELKLNLEIFISH